MSDQQSNSFMSAASHASSFNPAILNDSTCSTTTASNVIGEVEHLCYLADNIGSLYQSSDYSDVTLRVKNTDFLAHRVILAARSEYFRALLFGGLSETGRDYVELQETSAAGFKVLLRYIYTGKLSLASLKEEMIIDILGLAHKYGFVELETAICEYLRAVLNIRNLCTIYGAAFLFDLAVLSLHCLDFADTHASEILTSDSFFTLNAAAVKRLISRDCFCATEIEIFRAIKEWSNRNPADENVDSVIAELRLSLLSMNELLNIVRPSCLISADTLLDAIKEQSEHRDADLRYRGILLMDTNVAQASMGARVIEGELRQSLLNGDDTNYDLERGFTRHPIEENSAGIIIQLGSPYIINQITMLLWDKDQRSYSYIVEVSVNNQDWIRVVDYRSYLCRSKQRLFFASRVVRYIRILGTHNTNNKVFHLVSLDAQYGTGTESVNSEGIVIPRENKATTLLNATVIEGVSRSRNALLNQDVEHYDWDSGYTCHQLGNGAIVVQLPQPYVLDSMRLLLWDCDDRSYSYYIEVSTDQTSWTRVADKTHEACRSWQHLRFNSVVVLYVKIVGTHNTANEVFHCVHFECPGSFPEISDSNNTAAMTALSIESDKIMGD